MCVGKKFLFFRCTTFNYENVLEKFTVAKVVPCSLVLIPTSTISHEILVAQIQLAD